MGKRWNIKGNEAELAKHDIMIADISVHQWIVSLVNGLEFSLLASSQAHRLRVHL